ncbi:hypothetical protein R6Q57_021690 [Mikania cordata]
MLKKHFDKEGGYDNTTRTKQNPRKGMDPKAWVQVIDVLFTTSTYKNRSLKNATNRSKQLYGSYQWTQSYAQRPNDEENITDELNITKSTSSGDDTPVDEVEVLELSLGQRRGHVRGVGRTVKNITLDLPPHMYAPAVNELQQQLAEANARWAEQERINEMMQQQINKLMSMQGG